MFTYLQVNATLIRVQNSTCSTQVVMFDSMPRKHPSTITLWFTVQCNVEKAKTLYSQHNSHQLPSSNWDWQKYGGNSNWNNCSSKTYFGAKIYYFLLCWL